MRSILIIEENQAVLEHTATILKLAGHKIHTADTGQKGIHLATKITPDLILSAFQFSDIDGYGLLHLIRKNTKLAHIPFIFMSTLANRESFRKAMEMGADDYILKPFSDLELLNAVESRLKRMQNFAETYKNEREHPLDKYTYRHALKGLLENSSSNHYQNKEIVFSQGNLPQYLFYLKSGKVKAFKRNEEGKELTVQLYAAGDFIGYIALLGNHPYQITTKALEPCEIKLIPKLAFFELIKSSTAFSLEVIRVLAKHNNQKAEQMMQLAYNSLRKRVAQALLLLKKKFSEEGQEDFYIEITREELANISGTTTESLIRTLSDFKNEELIHIKGRSIRIIDPSRLKALPN